MSFSLTPFKSLVKARCGLVFEDHAEDKLRAAVRNRIATLAMAPRETNPANAVTDVAQELATKYHQRLCTDETEFSELVNLLTINETYFFREPDQISLLTGTLVPRLLARRGGEPLKLLSAGCSSGEEPYSLVIALWEIYGESVPRMFHVSAGDIDRAILEKARQGRYPEFSFRGVSPGLRQRYFDRQGNEHVLRERIRQQVRFRELNLLAPEPTLALASFDVIFFRNVSIYFDTPTRRTILQNLRALLRDDGCLVVGNTETMANDLGVLRLVEEGGVFYFVKEEVESSGFRENRSPLGTSHRHESAKTKAAGPATKAAAADASDGASAHHKEPHKEPRKAATKKLSSAESEIAVAQARIESYLSGVAGPSGASVQIVRLGRPPETNQVDIARLAAGKRFDEAMTAIEARLQHDARDVDALLLKAHVLLHRKEMHAAEHLARRVLEVAPWSVDACLVLGMAARQRDVSGEAMKWFRQAVYAKHECWPAHWFLFDLYRKAGEDEPARRACRVVLQLLATGRAPDTGVRVLPLGLPVQEVRFLCEHHLSKVARPATTATTATVATTGTAAITANSSANAAANVAAVAIDKVRVADSANVAEMANLARH